MDKIQKKHLGNWEGIGINVLGLPLYKIRLEKQTLKEGQVGVTPYLVR